MSYELTVVLMKNIAEIEYFLKGIKNVTCKKLRRGKFIHCDSIYLGPDDEAVQLLHDK